LTIQKPPVPIYSDDIIIILFTSDDVNEGLGFDADVIHDRCDSRLVPLWASSATVTDGSAPLSKYKTGLSCSWIVSPWATFERNAYIQIIFNYLLLGDLDVLTMYDGDSPSAPVLARMQGNKLKPNNSIITTSSKILVSFTTGQEQIGLPENTTTGFSFIYKVCTGKCLSCLPGTYFDMNDCKICPKYTISNLPAQLQCSPCPAGSEWKSSIECSSCQKGFYSSNGTECLLCPSGLIAPNNNMSSCIPCIEQNYYAVNSTVCAECASGTSTSGSSCTPLPVPEKPVNNQAVLIYLLVGLAIVIIGITVFAFFNRKKDNGYESVWTFS